MLISFEVGRGVHHRLCGATGFYAWELELRRPHERRSGYGCTHRRWGGGARFSRVTKQALNEEDSRTVSSVDSDDLDVVRIDDLCTEEWEETIDGKQASIVCTVGDICLEERCTRMKFENLESEYKDRAERFVDRP